MSRIHNDMEKNTISIIDCAVEYNGRARSTLERGQYLVIYKNDGSVAIHGASKTKPLNYLGSKTSISVDGTTITWKTKKESITIHAYQVLHTHAFNLSASAPVVSRTEKELVEKVINNWSELIGQPGDIEREKKTAHGPIDIYCNAYDMEIIVEVKRKTITLKDVTQVLRYGDTFAKKTLMYVAGPKISKNALSYATAKGVQYLHIDF